MAEETPPVIIDRRVTSPDDIKKAVKEAMLDRSPEDLNTKMNQLATQMTVGFDSVHVKQDLTNGKVLRAREDIDEINAKATYDKIIWFLLTAAITTITYLLTTKH